MPIPVPDNFEAYFVAGDVCMPTNIATGAPGAASAPTYPIRFDICRHRCITIDRAASIETRFQCGAGQCNMMIVAHAPAHRVQSQQDCDGRELPSPPPSECYEDSFTFDISPPRFTDGEYVTGPMAVAVPFMDLNQADEVSKRIASGEDAFTVIQQVVGPPPPARTWAVNFDPSFAVVSDGSTLAGGDCHTIPAP